MVVLAGCTAETNPPIQVRTTADLIEGTLRAEVTWSANEQGYLRWELSESPTFSGTVLQTTRRDFGPLPGQGGPITLTERIRSSTCAGISGSCTVIPSLKPSAHYYIRFCGQLTAPSPTGYLCFDSDGGAANNHDVLHTPDRPVGTGPALSGRMFTEAQAGHSLAPDTYDLIAAITGLTGPATAILYIDGQVIDQQPIACSPGCGDQITFNVNTTRLAVGQHAVAVVAKSNGGGSLRRGFSINTDPRSVYHAREFTGNPSAGGQLLAEEWVETATRSERHEEDGWLATRGLVPCDAAEPYGAQCAEVHERTTFSDADPSQADTYFVQTGLSHDDPTVKLVSDLLDLIPAGTPVSAQGPLSQARQPWQVAPPGAGSEYLRFERVDSMSTGDPLDGPNGEEPEPPETQVRVQVWIDQATRMPLRTRLETLGGQILDESFWTYEPRLLELSSLPANFFLAPRPANVELDEEVTSQTATMEGAQASTAKTASLGFEAHHFGNEITTSEGRFCLARLAVIRLWEPPGADPVPPAPGTNPGGWSVTTNAAYNRIGATQTCRPGKGSLEAPDLEVDSTADSVTADTWRYAYRKDGVAVPRRTPSPTFQGGLSMSPFGADPTTARVVPLDPRTSAVLVESGRTTVTITGPHAVGTATTQVAEIANRLEVAE
jgi:hypothetical protein